MNENIYFNWWIQCNNKSCVLNWCVLHKQTIIGFVFLGIIISAFIFVQKSTEHKRRYYWRLCIKFRTYGQYQIHKVFAFQLYIFLLSVSVWEWIISLVKHENPVHLAETFFTVRKLVRLF